MSTRFARTLIAILFPLFSLVACGFDPLDALRPTRTPSPTPSRTPVPMPTPQDMRPITSVGRIRGNPNARIVFVEWSDFQ